MFEYKHYERQTELGLRWYKTPAGFLPSITTILGQTQSEEKAASLKNWRESIGDKEADRVTLEATTHGTMVHLLAERFLKGEEVFSPVNNSPVSLPDRNAFNALKLKLKNITKIYGQEKSIYSPSVEVAGTFDCAGEYKGVPSIIDFKTSRRIKHREDIGDYAVQLAFYALAHNELLNTRITQGVILMVSEKGFPQEFIFDLPKFESELRTRAAAFWKDILSKV